jgi:hypothetical protein
MRWEDLSMTKRQISAKDFLIDLRSGLTDSDLISKYKITPKGLQSALRKLVEAEQLTQTEYRSRYSGYEDTVTLDLDSMKQSCELLSSCLVTIYDESDPNYFGSICDIAQNGFIMNGGKAKKDEVRTLVLDAQDFFEVDSFRVEARCRWCKQQNLDDFISGFEITQISERAKQHLDQLVRKVKIQELYDSGEMRSF